MKTAPFVVRTIEETITEESASRGDVATSEMSESEPADLRAALDALEGGCWDSIDVRGDGSLIAYPADWHRDIRTGEESAETLVIEARRPEWLDRLLDVYEARKRAERERDRARRLRLAYRDGWSAGRVAAAAAPGVHTSPEEARNRASRTGWPIAELLDPERRRNDRAFWLGYLRGLRQGVAAFGL